ncbi:MAG: MG2 domain-containing protein [Verrucomicrobia bacterium]|nr:MG2 domain-containing protein [Verrucomicrobiota bacterium]
MTCLIRLACTLAVVLGCSSAIFAQEPVATLATRRAAAQKLLAEGNYKEAYPHFSDLALDPANTTSSGVTDLNQAIQCLRNLNRVHETDPLREAVADAHAADWRILVGVAQSYVGAQKYGYIVAGEFERGNRRGGGDYAHSTQRDRIRALQLMAQARQAAESEDLKAEVAQFYLQFAQQILYSRGQLEAWRLQSLGNWDELPDYEAASRGYGPRNYGAPLDDDGNPVFHRLPKSFEDARSDGERWRWLLVQAEELSPGLSQTVKSQFAGFLHGQFGVQTMRTYGYSFGAGEDDGEEDESGPYALHSLTDDETIARTASGVKRFELPREFNHIAIFRELGKTPGGEHALNTLAGIYENRRQYATATEFWQESIKRFGPGHNQHKQKRVAQIVEPWGRFDPVMSQASGEAAAVDYRFRNGKSVSFDAHAIRVDLLLSDVKAYLRSNPAKLDWNQANIQNIGYRLVAQDQAKYIAGRVARWNLPLEPRKHHFDRRITVKTPLKEAGAYLVTARMADGNVSRIVIWLNDTVILKKQLDKKAWYYVGDARTGAPVAKATLSFFGYRQKYLDKKIRIGRRHDILTTEFAEFSDANGQVLPAPDDLVTDHNWLITATTDDGRLAYLGFSGVWYGNYHDQEYNQTKTFVITDRPVYRPDQSVQFKFWVRHAKYDQDDVSTFAKRGFEVRIRNAKGEEVFKNAYTADEFGGLEGDYALPGDAALGTYSIQLHGYGGGSFRVEEYKKPEFEVSVDAPSDPVQLGDEISATVTARYYFGAPVTEATVKIKVQRFTHDSRWYPGAYWDWFYGPGYWWFAYDYSWYPGWERWGCMRPIAWWWPQQRLPPELVSESESEIGEDGTLEVKIDTAIAKLMHGDLDHRYEITAEVVDLSRRTIVGKGSVLVARRPFKVYAWVDRGHYRVGDTVRANFSAQTLDQKPVEGKGRLTLYQVTYDKDNDPVEKKAQAWDLDTDVEGKSDVQIVASKPGQYRLSYSVTDQADHKIEGGYVFTVRGDGDDGSTYRFNAVELVTDQKEYAPGDTVKLQINTERADSTVVLFVRPANGVYLQPTILRLKGKSHDHEIEISRKDMPNIFVEAVTVSDGKVHASMREIIVPPEKRVLNVEVTPSSESYKPGEEGRMRVKVTDFFGEPFSGALVMSIYDKAVEYISGGSNVAEIRDFFWKWRRRHNPTTESNLQRMFAQLLKSGEVGMGNLGAFGDMIFEKEDGRRGEIRKSNRERASQGAVLGRTLAASAPSARMAVAADAMVMEESAEGMAFGDDGDRADHEAGGGGGGEQGDALVTPTVRSQFADTALWKGSLVTDQNGEAEVELTMPENLTTWKVRTWALGHGTKVGEGSVEVLTTKNLIIRLQAPRFFVETDEVVLSANVHNYLDSEKKVTVKLELDGNQLKALGKVDQAVTVPAGGEKRVDWRVSVEREGEAVVRMAALTDEESDAMQMSFPVYVHGMLKTDSFSAAIRPDGERAVISIDVPAERRINESRLEIRYSPSLAMAMVDALPYLVEYPYGCTEQTLNRFVPTVLTQKILREMGLDLEEVRDKITNLNAQEIGNDQERAAQWQRWNRNPVFDKATVDDMVKKGVKRLTAMQLSDGGWGWFSGWGERSYPHTTAVVVHGLQIARDNDVAIVPGVLERGVQWLERYQRQEIDRLRRGREKDPRKDWKQHADSLDAFTYMVLVDAAKTSDEMMTYLYEDRNHLPVYAKAMFGLALHKQGQADKLAMIMRNIEQVLVQDDENQTAYLDMPNGGYWWYWYGSEYEAHAYYLKLLAKVDPKSDTASRIVKYLLNNRKHATYWKSTRDTALCLEAFADYIRAAGEAEPDMTVEIYLDGRKMKEVEINADNLFTYDNALVLSGDAIESGKHEIEVRRKGKGPLYMSAYLTNFTLEEFIRKAGLEIKVERQYYRLEPVNKSIKVAGSHGQALDQRVEKYKRVKIENMAELKSGDLVEIELEIESKNDYEYVIFEDMKAAGFEPFEVRSGYTPDGLRAYMELRDERVAFFVRTLARGRHSIAYRMRAEIPGKFSALPARAFAMYAPELKGNSDEIKIRIVD